MPSAQIGKQDVSGTGEDMMCGAEIEKERAEIERDIQEMVQAIAMVRTIFPQWKLTWE